MNETHTAKEITAALLDALKHQGLCLKEALQMIEKGEEMAEIIHVPMVITVVDEGGNTVAIRCMATVLPPSSTTVITMGTWMISAISSPFSSICKASFKHNP